MGDWGCNVVHRQCATAHWHVLPLVPFCNILVEVLFSAFFYVRLVGGLLWVGNGFQRGVWIVLNAVAYSLHPNAYLRWFLVGVWCRENVIHTRSWDTKQTFSPFKFSCWVLEVIRQWGILFISNYQKYGWFEWAHNHPF